MDKILITGATGFVGSNLTKRLLNEGHEVHAIIRKTSNMNKLYSVKNNITFHEVDLTQRKLLKEAVEKINPEVIFHLASLTPNNKNIKIPHSEYSKVNICGTINLIDTCSDIDYKCFVNTGSSSEYGLKIKPMKEEDICNPVSSYGSTKLLSTIYGEMEGIIKNKPIINLRLFSPYGYYEDENKLIPYIIESMLKYEDVILGDPNNVKDYIFIDDVVDIYMQSINKAHKNKGQIFNVGSGKQHTTQFIAETLNKIIGLKSNIKYNSFPKNNVESPVWQADMTKTNKVFKLNLTPIEIGLKKTCLHYSQY